MKKSFIIIVCLMLISALGASYAQDVVATQKGPSSAVKGETVTITYTITNNGNEPIYNVMVSSQNFDKSLGTIGAGQNKTFTEKVTIPTDKQVQEDFGPDATVSNPFDIGSVGVSYQDANGNSFNIDSNSLSIPLVSSKGSTPGNNSSAATTTDQNILQQILDFINSIIQYIMNLF